MLAIIADQLGCQVGRLRRRRRVRPVQRPVKVNMGSGHRHRYLYDYELLRDVLTTAGFADVRRCSYREGAVADLEVLDNRPDETLYVEGSKGAPDRPSP